MQTTPAPTLFAALKQAASGPSLKAIRIQILKRGMARDDGIYARSELQRAAHQIISLPARLSPIQQALRRRNAGATAPLGKVAP